MNRDQHHAVWGRVPREASHLFRGGVFRLATFAAVLLTLLGSRAAELPKGDERGREVATLNTKRVFPEVRSAAEWQKLAAEIRENTAVACGLLPAREKTPLYPKVFGKIEREGYSVEKVYFQTMPGFYLAGNLYRPLGKGNGPFPAVLNPHGHWANGRMADEKDGSIAARCIQFARMGMIAFTYDMVGYNDTMQLPHRQSFLHPTNQLWNISMMGLQTWNSIRALDFLTSLPEVDATRLACTGESGGGTQTFILGAVDPRLAVVAPIVMVSHSMQGGCVCENAPGLRVEHSNMEIAAVPAPKPQIIVSATGDWTKEFMTVEGPAIASVYKLLGAEERLKYLVYEAPHNYNQRTREAVYGWFDRWLLSAADSTPRPEPPYKKEPDASLRVFPDGKMPSDAKNEEQLGSWLIEQAKAARQKALPTDEASFAAYENAFRAIWKQSLQVEEPSRESLVVERKTPARLDGFQSTTLAFGRAGKGDRIEAVLYHPTRGGGRKVAILTDPEGARAFQDANGSPKGLAREVVEAGTAVLCVDLFKPNQERNYNTNFYTTYNRTELQERAQDLLTSAAAARGPLGYERVVFVGQGRAGLWSAMAAPAANGIVADLAEIGAVTDEKLLARDLFAPGTQLFGAVEGAALLALRNPVLLHNTGGQFEAGDLKKSARALQRKAETRTGRAEAKEIAAWVSRL